MKILRFVLLGLAAFVLGALVWRLTTAPQTRLGQPMAQMAPVPMQPPKTTPQPPTATATAAPTKATAPAAPTTSPPAAETLAPKAPSQAQVEPPQAPAAPNQAPEVPPAPTGQAASAPPMVPSAVPAMTSQEAHEKVVAILAVAPDLSRAFDALRAQFPADAERTLAAATEAYRTTGTAPSPDDLFAEAMRDLRQSAGVLAAKAGPDALGAIFEAKAKVLGDLEQADPRICADYIYGGTSPEFADFQAGHRALIAASALATIEAMADGRTQQKTWGGPTADDFHQIELALAKRGLSPDEIAGLLDGSSPLTPPTDERLCDNARTYLDVLKSMPADARNRVYGATAELLARS